jgi:two-component system, chemotaxis family, protein-glutamate methylesterase/glutaminase
MAVRAEWAIAFGGSAGALTPLQQILKALPRDLPAAIFVALHTSPFSGDALARIVGGAVPNRPVHAPGDPEDICAGHIYISAPNQHLSIRGLQIELTRGPREHNARPAVDVLFRSAARWFGPRTIAVVLSGEGGDGAAGVIAVNARLGIVMVQDPDEADAPGMPLGAMAAVHPDFVLPAVRIPDMLVRLVGHHHPDEAATMAPLLEDQMHERIAHDIDEQEHGERDQQSALIVCPECGGVMWQTDAGSHVDFRCHIGHRYAADTLLVQKTAQVEAAFSSALRVVREKAMLLRQMANHSRAFGDSGGAERLDAQADVDEAHAMLIFRDLLEAEPSSLTIPGFDREVVDSQRPNTARSE